MIDSILNFLFFSSCLLGDVQVSLCGNINQSTSITDDIFDAHLVPYDTFASNPSIINDPNLVVRIAGKYYNWEVASALIASTSIYHKHLPEEAVESLQDKHMGQAKSQTSSSTASTWWLFSGRKNDAATETNAAAAEALALAVKSEVVPPILKADNLARTKSYVDPSIVDLYSLFSSIEKTVNRKIMK